MQSASKVHVVLGIFLKIRFYLKHGDISTLISMLVIRSGSVSSDPQKILRAMRNNSKKVCLSDHCVVHSIHTRNLAQQLFQFCHQFLYFCILKGLILIFSSSRLLKELIVTQRTAPNLTVYVVVLCCNFVTQMFNVFPALIWYLGL